MNLEKHILDLYKQHNDKDKVFKNPDLIKGYGASDRFGWAPYGWSHYAIFHLLEPALNEIAGDILEVGAHEGSFTKILCDYGMRAQKQVFVVDPWNGEQQGDAKVYKTFLERTEQYKNLGVFRTPSQSMQAAEAIGKMGCCFAWVDGLHKYDAVKEDLRNVKRAFHGPGIIGIDDVRGPFPYNPQLWQAVCEAEDELWKHVESPGTCVYSFLVREK